MRSQNTGVFAPMIYTVLISCVLMWSHDAFSQSSKYSRKRPAKKLTNSNETKKSDKKESDKLDISDLEKKYWAPKDTDFTVVQNRSYSKVKRVAVNLLAGPVVNETFSTGLSYGLGVSYYFSERHGMEFLYLKGTLKDSKTTNTFRDSLSGGGVGPDYNRPTDYMGVSYNWVPFYAKMSVLGKRIIYFDMQISPGIGLASYDQITDTTADKTVETTAKSAVALSLDITQFFFIHKNFAIRADLRNRWYKQDVLKYTDGSKGRSETANVTQFLIGATYFF